MMTCHEDCHEKGYQPFTTQFNLPHPEYDPLLPGHTLVQRLALKPQPLSLGHRHLTVYTP